MTFIERIKMYTVTCEPVTDFEKQLTDFLQSDVE